MSDGKTRNLAVPFFTQRDNTYVWQKPDGNGSKYPMAWRTCNITCLCMILHYWGITKETPNEMIERIYDNQEWFRNEGGQVALESWENLRKIAEFYIKEHTGGNNSNYKIIKGKEDFCFSMEFLEEKIQGGYPVMVSTGLASVIDDNNTYKKDGHIVVVRGITDTGDIILNDPFGIPVDNDNKIKALDGISSTPGKIAGWYYNSEAASPGDNIIIKREDFNNVCCDSNGKFICIEGPLWQKPGGRENDFSNSYPIKANNMWHNGIHLESAQGFYSIGCGRLVAARNSDVEGHGSSSFALIKYQLPGEKIKPFYALYMHLQKIDLKQELRDFFLKNNGRVSDNLRNTWYEQIFNNLLPNYMIMNYKLPERLDPVNEENYKVIYKATIDENTYKLSPTKELADLSNLGGNLSKHLKVYLIPPDGRLKNLCEIDNYKSLDKLKFMVATRNTKLEDSENYYYFYLGTSDNRQLCCCKGGKAGTTDTDVFASYYHVNEASYKYYIDCIYNLYTGNTVIFKKTDTTVQTEKGYEDQYKKQYEDLMNKSILKYSPVLTDDNKIILKKSLMKSYLTNLFYSNYFILKKHKLQGKEFVKLFLDDIINANKAFYLEDSYQIIKDEMSQITVSFETLIREYIETGNNGLLEEYKELIKSLDKALKTLLSRISSEIEKKEAEYGILEAKTGEQWMKYFFEDAEQKLDCLNKIGTVNGYDVEKGMPGMCKQFADMIEEYQEVDIAAAIAICVFLMLEFVSIPKEKSLTAEDRFPFIDFEHGETYKMLHQSLKKVLNSYEIFFNKRYIDKYIEIPKGAKIGNGTKIPDTDKTDSIHFEIFSKDNLLPEQALVEDSDEDHFYDPKKITESIISGLGLTGKEMDHYVKYAKDNVIGKKEIEQLYTETDYLKKLVTRHRSEWKNKTYTENEIASIVNATNFIKKIFRREEICTILDYYNGLYSKYNWLDKKMEKELETSIFYYYHPLYFLEQIQ